MPGQSRPKRNDRLLFCPFKRQYRDKNNVVFCNLEEAKLMERMGHEGGSRVKTLREVSGVLVRRTRLLSQGIILSHFSPDGEPVWVRRPVLQGMSIS